MHYQEARNQCLHVQHSGKRGDRLSPHPSAAAIFSPTTFCPPKQKAEEPGVFFLPDYLSHFTVSCLPSSLPPYRYTFPTVIMNSPTSEEAEETQVFLHPSLHRKDPPNYYSWVLKSNLGRLIVASLSLNIVLLCIGTPLLVRTLTKSHDVSSCSSYTPSPQQKGGINHDLKQVSSYCAYHHGRHDAPARTTTD